VGRPIEVAYSVLPPLKDPTCTVKPVRNEACTVVARGSTTARSQGWAGRRKQPVGLRSLGSV